MPSSRLSLTRHFAPGLFAAVIAGLSSTAHADYEVHAREINDLKAVFATVASVDMTLARARVPGTLRELHVDEGSAVEAGQRIAVVVDAKIPSQISAIDARLRSLTAQQDLAQSDFDRTQELFRKGTVSQSRLDAAQANLDVLKGNIAAQRAERAVVTQRLKEGEVLAPASGRVLRVPVTEGSVMQPGEVVAEIATRQYILRLSLPERHARFIKEGDPVMVGQRGLDIRPGDFLAGTVKQVYPEIKAGRVEADVNVAGLGDYFVGERTRVWVSAGKRQSMVVPPDYIFRRYGVSYVKLRDGTEVVVQPGLSVAEGMEILSGLREGDVLVMP